MSRTELAVATSLPWLVLLAGLAALLLRRRRAARAVGFALPVVALMAATAAVYPLVQMAPRAGPWVEPLMKWTGVGFDASSVALAAGWVLLPVAAMLDRRPPDGG